MAILGRWTGGVIGSLAPTTAWAAPANLFPAQARNDGSSYGFAAATSTITVPAASMPDGYLLRASVETEDSSNGRYNIQGRFVQSAGASTVFKSFQTSGYSRDNSEDRAFLQVFAVVHGPAASSQFAFQWKRDTDAPGTSDGTVNSAIEIIPLYYSAIGIYGGSTAAALNGTTRNVVGLAAEHESDTNAIQISSNLVTLKGVNKRYVILGNVYGEGFSNGSRTQRRLGLDVDGAQRLGASGYFYARSASNDNNGAIVSDLIETAGTEIGVELTCWAGDGVAAFQGGSEAGGSTPALAYNALVVIELNDSAEVFRSYDSGSVSGTGGTEIALTGPVDLPCVETLSFNDAASFTKAGNTAVNIEQAGDYFFCGSEFNARGTLSSGSRLTWRTHITQNGVEDSATRHGNYSRGQQSTTDTFGGGSTPAGFMACAVNDDVGISAQEIAGTEGGGGDVETIDVGFWGLNLDTLSGGGVTHYTLPAESGSYSHAGVDAGLKAARVMPASAGALMVTGLAVALTVAYSLPAETSAYALSGIDAGLVAEHSLAADPGAIALSGSDAGLAVSYTLAADVSSYTLTGLDATLTVVNAFAITAESGAYTLSGADAGLVADRTLPADPGAIILTGQGADLAVSYTLPADVSSYALTGLDAGFVADRSLPAGAGSYAINGIVVGLVADRSMNAAPGSVVLTGSDATLTVANAFAITAEPGVYTLSGADAGLVADRALPADPGSVVLTGLDAVLSLSNAFAITADPGAYALSGIGADLAADRALPADPGAITLIGQDAGLALSVSLSALPGAYTLNGVDAGLVVDRKLTADPGSVALIGQDAALVYGSNQILTADSGAYTLNGNDAVLAVGRSLTADPGAISLTGLDAALSVANAYVMAAESGGYVVVGVDATLYVSGIPQSEARTIHIPASDRLITVSAEDRLIVIGPADRAIVISADDRVVAIPAVDRIIRIE
ncbi:MAG: hypothetical protein AB2806_08880 [Candidatus Thiodiazotropha sp.]